MADNDEEQFFSIPAVMTSTIPFPTSDTLSTSAASEMMSQQKHSEMSMVSCNPLTYQVCGFVYDNNYLSPSFLDTAELFYESRAGNYENPLITATSRALIADIHTLIRQFSVIDIPKPSTILSALFHLPPPDPSLADSDPWLRLLRIWSEVEEFSESESFDGHKRSTVEHTLNILLFPDLHIGFKIPKSLSLRASTPASEAIHELSLILPGTPSLPVPGTPFAVPSPLHLQLPILTRLSFNEQGRITYHRDLWDMRDVIRLLPGMRVAQWILGRAGAWGLSWMGKRLRGQSHPGSLIMSSETAV